MKFIIGILALVGAVTLFAAWQGVPLGDVIAEIEEFVRGLS